MATRKLFGVIDDGHGSPRANYKVILQLTPGAYTATAALPEWSSVVMTNDAGYFEAMVVTGVRYKILMYDSFVVQGTLTAYGNRNVLEIVVPHGTTDIDLATVIALATQPDPDPDLATIANAHVGRHDNPHMVTAHQVDAYTQAETDNAIQQASGDVQGNLDAHEQRTDNPHEVTASQLSDLDNEVSASPDVAANTAARHTHANKSVLDATEEPFTTAEHDKLAGIEDEATANATDAELRDRATHTGEQAISTVTGLQDALDAKASTVALNQHAGRTDNPHAVTAHQTGAYTQGEVDNAVAGVSNNLTAHANRTDNPHAVTAAQVGLGNVDNTSDADKPVSTAQGVAIAAKQDAPATAGQWWQALTHGTDGPEWSDTTAPVPLAVVTPQGSASREGPFDVDVPDANVDVTADSWQLWRGIGDTSLLVSPDGSYDASGKITLDTVGDVQTVSGQYGRAWRGSGYMSFSWDPYVSLSLFAIIYRARFTDANNRYPISINGMNGVWLGRLGSGAPAFYLGGSRINPTTQTITQNTYVSIAVTNDTGRASIFVDGINAGSAQLPDADPGSRIDARYGATEVDLESVIVYQHIVSQSEIARISTMPRRWEWGPDGHLTIPHAQRPASILVRHRSGGNVSTQHVTLDSGTNKATFGAAGTLHWTGAALIVGTTNMTEVLGVATFADPLPIYPGIIVTPSRWTFGGMHYAIIPPYPTLPATIMGYYPPTHKIATGGATLRTAPGASTTAITALAADTQVHDTGERETVSSVAFALLQTKKGQGWTEASKIIAL